LNSSTVIPDPLMTMAIGCGIAVGGSGVRVGGMGVGDANADCTFGMPPEHAANEKINRRKINLILNIPLIISDEIDKRAIQPAEMISDSEI